MENNILRYVSQTDTSYTVTNSSGNEIRIAKPYVSHENYRTHTDSKDTLVQMAAIGLPLGGIVTIILSPLVIWKNIQILRNEKLIEGHRTYAQNLIIISILLFLFGVGFFSLFMMHLIL